MGPISGGLPRLAPASANLSRTFRASLRPAAVDWCVKAKKILRQAKREFSSQLVSVLVSVGFVIWCAWLQNHSPMKLIEGA